MGACEGNIQAYRDCVRRCKVHADVRFPSVRDPDCTSACSLHVLQAVYQEI